MKEKLEENEFCFTWVDGHTHHLSVSLSSKQGSPLVIVSSKGMIAQRLTDDLNTTCTKALLGLYS